MNGETKAWPKVAVVAYEASCLPYDHPDRRIFTVRIEKRSEREGRSLWAVVWMGDNLSASGRWDREPQPSSRTEAWLAGHRFDLDAAMTLAMSAARLLEVNGLTVDDVLAGPAPNTIPANETQGD